MLATNARYSTTVIRFKQRVAKSKFGKMPLFAKSGSGYLSLQGDHGQVSFRNIKVLSLEAKSAQAKPAQKE